ncbi:MAG TPA: DUF1549 domain-containing protein, partial [Urbifossiella sp.]|nr:DUF1549 domain-containing protein [Urbifossiella sp.]
EPGTPPPAEPTVTAYPEPPDEAPAPAKLPPPAGAGDEPAIDDIVKKEAPKYAAGEKAKGDVVVLTPVAARAGGARDPGRVAAEIDRILDARLAAAGTPASPPAAPAEFHRRAYLDITGCIPPVAKTRAFLGDISPDRQARLIEELLAAHDYGDHFAQYWHELLVKRDPENNGPIQTHDVYVKWLTRQFNQNRPWDQVVKTMLTAEGDQALAGETFFVLANSENGQPAPDKIVGTAAALFLGNQLQCAECHVHPVVSKWTQQDFWGLAAFFGRTRAVRNGAAKMPTEVLARIVDGGPAPAPKKGAAAMPGTLPDGSIAIPDPRTEGRVIGVARAKLFGDGFAPVPPNSVTRAFAADWFASARNPFFARAAVNRLWSVFFGRGLVNPLDDIRPDSRVSHLEVLELLAEEFAASGYDVKHLVRCLCRTAAYQRSSRTLPQNKDDDELYSHMAVKVIPPRTLFACLALVTNNQIRSPREDRGGKNGAPADGIGFYDTREYDESPTEYTNGVPQLLRLMNTQLPPACEAVARSLRGGGSRESVVEHLYLLALGRPPTPTEADRLGRFIGTQNDPVKGYAIALWVLLQTSEFFNNH